MISINIQKLGELVDIQVQLPDEFPLESELFEMLSKIINQDVEDYSKESEVIR